MFSFGASVISHLKASQNMDMNRVHESSASIECNSMETRKDEVIIVGAGVAGAALAYSLGKDGRQVLLVERNLNEPNRIVGELLQPGGYKKLTELGLDDCVEDIDAQRILGYALYEGGKCVKVDYNLDKSEPNVAGRSFHNGRFVQRMRNKAASLSNVHLEQGLVTSLVEERGTVKGVIYKTGSGQELSAHAPLTIVCDGCFSSLRGSLSKSKVTKHRYSAGLILENCQAPYPGYVHLILADQARFSLYPISSGEYRAIIDIPGTKIPSVSNGDMAYFLKAIVAPEVPPEFYSAFMAAVEGGKVRFMPTSSMPATPYSKPGAILLGDALNMRHPIAGGGMTVALYDVVTLRDQLRRVKDFEDTAALTKVAEKFYSIRKLGAFKVNICSGGFYELGAPNQGEAKEEIMHAIFDYLSLSSILRHGAIQLISCLNPKPWILILNCIGLAVFVIGRLLLPLPTPAGVLKLAKVIWASATILVPIIWEEGLANTFFHIKFPGFKWKFWRKRICWGQESNQD